MLVAYRIVVENIYTTVQVLISSSQPALTAQCACKLCGAMKELSQADKANGLDALGPQGMKPALIVHILIHHILSITGYWKLFPNLDAVCVRLFVHVHAVSSMEYIIIALLYILRVKYE